ncbi:SDR family oxidoreductase [Spirosoma utsteinense]|uniref:NADP-dependent 3-hydroxy acid dehydrogenase YdfG n=1 Tax=Spirosoma utsteinense TaxID=2585773 RepID=A0ABR6W370_9BACT|nr:SDR family oxidoreductase [Spirosoma utsteinense]MBC3786671.1 NADP-dependent 3-hydroxy acid dehydrogenase YdfG [Spirosoma utsteinense]MBC3791034.1 NADP-dependent 3-hydroxy acid dehydrogenase YdfG [Spirosoma utsteinense]
MNSAHHCLPPTCLAHSFSSSVIWITGASSGIGEAIALALASQGARLVLSARRADELQRVADLTGLPASDVLVLPLDMTDTTGLAAHVETVRQRFGRIDYIFQNAGITQRSQVADTDLSVYRQLMDVNFFGVVALTKAVLPLMLAQGSGHIVVTSSVAGKIGTKQRSGYCASKHALHGFFDALRAETHEAGLRVTIVCPGYIRTPISLHALGAGGQVHGKMDENQARGMAPDAFARQLLRAVSKQKEEVYIGGPETYGIYLKRFLPGLLSRILRNRAGA